MRIISSDVFKYEARNQKEFDEFFEIALKLIHDNFHPGDKIVNTESSSGTVMTQGYVTRSGQRKLLIVNKRDNEISLKLPQAQGGKLEVVDQSTGFNPPSSEKIEGQSIKLGGLAVAVVTLPANSQK